MESHGGVKVVAPGRFGSPRSRRRSTPLPPCWRDASGFRGPWPIRRLMADGQLLLPSPAPVPAPTPARRPRLRDGWVVASLALLAALLLTFVPFTRGDWGTRLCVAGLDAWDASPPVPSAA